MFLFYNIRQNKDDNDYHLDNLDVNSKSIQISAI